MTHQDISTIERVLLTHKVPPFKRQNILSELYFMLGANHSDSRLDIRNDLNVIHREDYVKGYREGLKYLSEV